MHGATTVKANNKAHKLETIILTPERAAALLEHNKINRPIRDSHVSRIERQIIEDKWRFNGDTIKISEDGDVLDGQHRLWAVLGAKKPVDTILVHGIARDAFATIDTVRQQRSGGDVLALSGATRYRTCAASVLQWLLRHQRGCLEDFRAPQNRIENSDIEQSFAAHPGIMHAVEKAMPLRDICNPAVLAFVYYILVNKNEELAERMMVTLEDPAGVAVSDPFFRFRSYLTHTRQKRREPLMTIALAFKAINADARGEKMQVLAWRNQGDKPEAFPTLQVKRG